MRDIKVAVIDDNKYTVEAIKKCLGEFTIIDGYTDPVIALKEIKQNRHELVITDNSMPHMDGVELAEKILEIYYPVVILISIICDQVEKEFNGKDLFDYTFQKPLDFEEFTLKIKEIINNLKKPGAKILDSVEIKDKLYLDEIVKALLTDELKDCGYFKKLSVLINRDESSIRRRLNKIISYLNLSEELTPLDLILLALKESNQENDKEKREMHK